MSRILTFLKKPAVLLVGSALLAALPLTFSSLFFLSWVAFIPYFCVLIQSAGKGKWLFAVGRGFLFGFCYHAFVYFWFLWLYPFEFIGFSKPVALAVTLVAWLGASAIHGFFYVLPALLSRFFFRILPEKRLCGAFVIAAGFLFSEKITELGALAFPWVRVALGQYRAPVFIQLASVLGIYGVDFLILSVNALVAVAFFCSAKKKMALVSAGLCLFALNLGFGIVRTTSAVDKTESVSVALVQGSVLSGEKWEENSTAVSYERYMGLTDEIIASGIHPDLVLWPESAVPITLSASGNDAVREAFQEKSEKLGAPILMGTFSVSGGKSYNSAVLVRSDSVSAPYSKRHLVPFGEYLPYRGFFTAVLPSLAKINMLSEDLGKGEDSGLMETENGEIGCEICFESIFPYLGRQSVADGAGLLAVLTNDSWYEDSPAVYQHLAHAVFRSVENSRCTVRCANSGVSALIDSRGRITSELGPLKKGILSGTVYYSDSATVYTRVGDVIFPIVAAGVILWSVSAFLCERRKKHGAF